MLRPALGVAVALALCACGSPSASEDEGGSSESDTGSPAGGPPPAPTLESPADGAVDVAPISELCWRGVEDPDGDAVGYRVWVDEVELTNGELGEYGFVGTTCTGPLNFADDRSFTWRVRAFEVEDPERESADSPTWSFSTARVEDSEILFADDFSMDLGWTVSGDATTGAWVRGRPRAVVDEHGETAQPDGCFAGMDCWYTGANPDAELGEADVDGGSVVLTSPPFDPGSATSLSISLARFFYRSDLEPTGVSLELALLVPDPGAPGGETVHVLDKLDGGEGATPANAWSSVAFSACGIELPPGMRLRITASDLVPPEAVIAEAAIDAVVVEGYPDSDVCSPGVGALCDPDDPLPACGEELLCCAEGPIFDGVYRCMEPTPELGDSPPAEPGGPLTGPLGCPSPDLVLLDKNLLVYTEELFIEPDACSLYEGCVIGPGWRKLLRFDTKTANAGAVDLVLGIPANHPDLFTYSPCHDHHHFDDYAAYTLLDGDEVVAVGHKQAFCLLDYDNWAWPELGEDGQVYTCFNQGLSVGWSDTYRANLDCQWIDVTDVAPGSYTLRMDINVLPAGKAQPTLVERRYDNNRLEIPVLVD